METKIHSDRCVGIDFGTTNSVLASVMTDNQIINTPVRPINRRVGMSITEAKELLPSCVFYPQGRDGKCGTPIVGDYAKQQSIPFPGRVARSVKMHLDKTHFPGLDSTIPDEFKTTVGIASHIIRHMIQDAGKAWHENITDAVITVPANFGPIQSQIVLQAAESAGLEVRDDKGNFDDSILLSEPEAVMYYVLNEIDAGRSDIALDLSEEKYVLIYDIGGGTTDITIHRIKRDPENPKLIDMDDVATNRFSGVAGDAFDNLVAEAMYERCLNQYKNESPAIAKLISGRRGEITQSMKNYAEQLKFGISTALFEENYTDLEDGLQCGGNLSINYPYTDYFTLEEYTDIVADLLAEDLTIADYAKSPKITDRDNIIWPVLDVLNKATSQMKTPEMFRPDVVILSGGMSSFGVVRDRITSFFGDIPVYSCNNPNSAVAQGAAVYHYYQHKESALLKKIHEKNKVEETETATAENVPEIQDETGFIRTKNVALNESIYLGLANGAVLPLAKAGDNLPLKGSLSRLNIASGTKNAQLPIKQEDFDDAGKPVYRTVALGILTFYQGLTDQINIDYEIKRSKIITISAVAGSARAFATITPDQKTSFKPLRMTADGVDVDVANEIATLRQLCRNMDDAKHNRSVDKKNSNIARIEQAITTAQRASNKQEYSKIINWLHEARTYYDWNTCTQIARVTMNSWSEKDVREYMRIVSSKVRSWINMPQMNADAPLISLITAVSKFGNESQLAILDNEKFRNATMSEYYGPVCRAYAKLGIHTDWIYGLLEKDTEYSGYAAAAIGKIFHDKGEKPKNTTDKKIIEAMLTVAKHRNQKTFMLAIKGLALFCDQSVENEHVTDYDNIIPVSDYLAVCLRNRTQYEPAVVRILELANGVISGIPLNEEDITYIFTI